VLGNRTDNTDLCQSNANKALRERASGLDDQFVPSDHQTFPFWRSFGVGSSLDRQGRQRAHRTYE